VAWSGAVGTTLEGTPMAVGDRVEIASATKIFTATLVMQAADQGLIDLDAPLPQLDAVPWFPYSDQLTARELLEHRSALVDYRATDIWLDDPTRIASPIDAVTASGYLPLQFAPGTEQQYSSVNYMVLGLLLEQVTGRSYDDLLATNILGPLKLAQTTHLESEPGAPRGGAAGIQSTLSDLLLASDGLLKHHSLVSAPAWDAINHLDLVTGMGAGIAGYCPCSVNAAGVHSFFAIGFTGTSTFMAYVPSLDVAIAIQVGDDFFTQPSRMAATVTLIHDLTTKLAAVH
ncbi:MAG: serine hydrolase domain-containing protein, partial [Acidimicrobiia bacterium]